MVSVCVCERVLQVCVCVCVDDGWLEVSPGELDAMMRRAAGYVPGMEGRERDETLENVVHGMKSFVDTISSHEGAELPW